MDEIKKEKLQKILAKGSLEPDREKLNQKIQKIHEEKKEYIAKFSEEKGELIKIMRADFLTGGIIMSSLILILTSLMGYFELSPSYILLTGVAGLAIGIIILISPIISSLIKQKKFDDSIYHILVAEFSRILNNLDDLRYTFLLRYYIKRKLHKKDMINYFKKSIETIKMLINSKSFLEDLMVEFPETYHPIRKFYRFITRQHAKLSKKVDMEFKRYLHLKRLRENA